VVGWPDMCSQRECGVPHPIRHPLLRLTDKTTRQLNIVHNTRGYESAGNKCSSLHSSIAVVVCVPPARLWRH
jgi:hypothetical protein